LWKAYEGYGDKNLIKKLNECFQEPACVKLNSRPNKAGFDERERKGRDAGKAFVQSLKALRLIDGDEINIVCHSMGFAYAQGIIAVLKDAIRKKELPNLVFNGYFIIAPENPNSGSVNTTEWKQIWQYGSHEGQLADRPWLQDGVAPQAPIDNIGANRAYIPIADKNVPQGFLESHFIENYGWIFRLDGGKGYVLPRK
jgi:hypothetical protein